MEARHGEAWATARCVGPFELRTLDGRDLTPKRSAKAQALLFLLLMADDQARSRSFLIETLWSERQPLQGARSLKSEMHTIRKALGDMRDLLVTDGGMVRLARGAVLRDFEQPNFEFSSDRDLFEGTTVKDPAFLQWLRQERRLFNATHERPTPPRIVIARDQSGLAMHTNLLAGGISQTIRDWTAADIVSQGRAAEDGHAVEAGYEMRVSALGGAEGVAGVTRLARLSPETELWQGIERLDGDPVRLIEDSQLYRLINTSVDRSFVSIAGEGDRSRDAALLQGTALGAISNIFRNEGTDLEDAAAALTAAYEAEPRGVLLAWRAYILAFHKGERGVSGDLLRDEAEYLARRALEMDPGGSMGLALVSYINTYLLGSPEFGLQLADQAVAANRANALAWAFRSAALYILGQTEDAYQSARFGRSIAGMGPYRYAVETYFCVAATMSNRLEEATQAGEAVFRLKPEFRAPLRYLAVLYAAQDRQGRASDIIEHLRRDEPDFSIRKMLQTTDYPSEILKLAPIVRSLS